jgi:archaellum component FlaC
MNLADMMEGMREAASKNTKFVGINLTQVEINPILAEYDTMRAEVERLKTGWETAFNIGVSEQEQNKKLRAEIERLQGHMRALADTSVARDTAGIFKGLWQGSEQECEELRAEIERLREIGNATFMAMCAFRDNNDEECFQDAIDSLGTALRKDPQP